MDDTPRYGRQPGNTAACQLTHLSMNVAATSWPVQMLPSKLLPPACPRLGELEVLHGKALDLRVRFHLGTQQLDLMLQFCHLGRGVAAAACRAHTRRRHTGKIEVLEKS